MLKGGTLSLRLASLFVITLLMLTCALQARAQTQDTVIIEVGGYVWNKTTLNTLIVTSENQSWWSPVYVNSTLRAIDDWNHAITYFAGNYSQFSYLSAVNLQAQISNQTLDGFDIYVSYAQSVAIGTQDSIGLTTTIPLDNGTIQKCVIALGTQSQYLQFTEKDIQSVATHEFGHAIGIGHSNSSTDLMYPQFDIYAAQIQISTLDMYGVANAFQWITNPNLPVPTAKQNLSLPPDIPFAYIPSASPPPQSIEDNPAVRAIMIVGNILLTPYILIMIIAGVSVMAFIEVAFRRKRKAKNTKNLNT
jgi:predicted Zn-dependent protease